MYCWAIVKVAVTFEGRLVVYAATRLREMDGAIGAAPLLPHIFVLMLVATVAIAAIWFPLYLGWYAVKLIVQGWENKED